MTSNTEFDRIVRNSRLADRFGEACAEAAEATKTKEQTRELLIAAAKGSDSVLFAGQRYDVTLTGTRGSKTDWEAVARELARVLGEVTDKADAAALLTNVTAKNTKRADGVRVAAKARIEREAA